MNLKVDIIGERLFGGFTMEDKRITEMFFDKNENAIKELEKKYGQLLKTLARNVLGNTEDAEECVNDCLLEIWNSIPPNNPEYLMAYSCKIVRRIAINKLKYNLRQKRDVDKSFPIEEMSDYLAVSGEEEYFIESENLHGIINDFIKELDEESRALFVRRYFFFESVSSLSERFGISENKISVRLHRARKKLAEILKREGIYE